MKTIFWLKLRLLILQTEIQKFKRLVNFCKWVLLFIFNRKKFDKKIKSIMFYNRKG